MAISIEFACNDHRNGNLLGCADHFIIRGGTDRISLEGGRVSISHSRHQMASVKPAIDGNQTLRVGRILIPCFNYQTWVGNWCWDQVSDGWPAALKVLNYLASKPDWHCEEAACEIYEAFNDRRVVTAEEW